MNEEELLLGITRSGWKDRLYPFRKLELNGLHKHMNTESQKNYIY